MARTPTRTPNRRTSSGARRTTPRGTPNRRPTATRRAVDSPARPQNDDVTRIGELSPATPHRSRGTTAVGKPQEDGNVRGAGTDAPGVDESQLSFEMPRALLPSIFGHSDIDIDDVRSIIRRLRRVQDKGRGRHRFHLIVESDQGEVVGANSERYDHVVTRVLFSPSVSLESMHADFQVSLLARVLNGISWRNTPTDNILPEPGSSSAVRPPAAGDAAARVPVTEPVRPTDEEEEEVPHREVSGRAPLPNDAVAHFSREIRDALRFPSWFPFLEKEYTEGPQVSSETLLLDRDPIENFEYLAPAQVYWIYREFFEFLHREAKFRKYRGIQRVFKYSYFTPPWLRSQIIKGQETNLTNQNPVFLNSVALPDMRNQRSKMGAKRLSYILGAFYAKEMDMACDALNHLVRVVPRNPSLQRRRCMGRVGHMLSSAPRLPGVSTRRPQQSGSIPAVGNTLSLPRLRNTQSQSGNEAVLVQDNDRGEGQSVLGRRRRAGRIQEEMINVDDTPDENENRGPRRRRVLPKLFFGDSEDSDGVRGNGNKTTEQRNVLRRRTDANESEDAEDRRLRELFEDGVENDHRTMMIETQVATRKDDEIEPKGDEDDDDIGQRRTDHECAPSSHAHQVTSVRIVCAFRTACKFSGNPDMQNNSRVTGRCRVETCRAIMHDMCGGGEFGDMLCPGCQAAQQALKMSSARIPSFSR